MSIRAVNSYHTQIRNNLERFATWFPGDHIEIGDFGKLVGGRVRREGNLAELGIGVEVEVTDVPQPISYSSTKGLSVNAQVGAAGQGLGKAVAEYSFSSAGACVFEATGVRHHRIRNRHAVGQAIVAAHEAGTWTRGWYLIEELWSAACTTVIIAQTKDSSLTLAAELDSPVPALLTNPEAGLRVTARSGKIIEIIGVKDARPLYACCKLKLFDRVSAMRGGSDASQDDPFVSLTLDEMSDSLFE